MTTRGVRSPTTIHFTIDGRHGILKARHLAEALQIPYEPENPFTFRKWSPVSHRDMHSVQRRWAILDTLFRISEGFYFGPHQLIIASLIHFEEKLKRRRLCRERFSLNKWNQLAGYYALPGVLPMVAPPMPPQPEQGELPTETVPPVPTSKPTSVAPPITSFVPLVAPTTSEPSITIFFFGVSRPGAYLSDTHHHSFYSLPADG
ncbi:hypothetical protein CK203_053470 [Vitis vinifera]|uniref:Uncharacterized protein n=1 Tax=Vitis vinifera TaxID=29760 RepID=A0A438GYY3_VITVI|nr:hypothetical protein CK203_053470 [Vitis vinifera]